MKILIILASLFFCQFAIQTDNRSIPETEDLYAVFQNPPAEAKAFVRWWWNGNRVNEKEVLRELDVLKRAGFGGVEINPIAMPPVSDEPTQEALKWLSPEWNQVLKAACIGAKERGMIADLLVGSGWPFGGKFLTPDQTIERMAVNYRDIRGSQNLVLKVSELEDDLPAEYLRGRLEQESERRIQFVRLVPANLTGTDEIIDLKTYVKDGTISYEVPEGQYRLVWGVLQKGFREVVYGTLGADGPTMNHLDAEVTLAFLNRLKEIERDLKIPLADLVRALFCDSIELAGSNWCQDFTDEFLERCGYALDPYFPFIFYYSADPYPYDIDNLAFKDTMKRVRFDYNRVLVDLFQERFTAVFKQFCQDNELQCRYQAYGSPWLIGILDGYLQADIPESNNWFYVQNSFPDTADHFTWVKNHGSLIWNKYAAAGAHLNGKSIVSCEAMTNLGGVFKASLSTIKQADDMNFITGITHSVLHGFNYSPPEAGFPGWIRYGTFFSEHNTLWPHFTNWLRYNSRLSAVLQNSDPVVEIAILAPEADTWSEHGLRRIPFHLEPWYVFDLWEAISQTGSSCDYINERVIQEAQMKKGRLNYGPMAYQTLIIADVSSMEAATAKAVYQFAKKGGKLVFVGQEPFRSSTLSDPDQDEIVKEFMQKLQAYQQHIIWMDAPAKGTNLIDWMKSVYSQLEWDPALAIDSPDRSLYQIHHQTGDTELFFITNTNRKRKIQTDVGFDLSGKRVWKWNALSGEREPVSTHTNGLHVDLDPLESMLIVIEPGRHAERTTYAVKHELDVKVTPIQGTWTALFEPVSGEPFSKTFSELPDFKNTDDPLLQNFAGKVIYSNSFNATESRFRVLDLGNANDGVTSVELNGMSLGTSWYGPPRFELDGQMRLGPNTIKIEYTSLLWNYCASLDQIETSRWIRDRDPIPNGLVGPVLLR